MKKLSELSIADLYAVRNLCQEREERSARNPLFRHPEEYKLVDLLDRVAEELACRVVDLCDHTNSINRLRE